MNNNYLSRIENGKNSAKKVRKKYVDSYNLNPNFCKNCGNKIEILGDEPTSTTRKKKFCSHTCSSTFNNLKRPKKEKVVTIRKDAVDITKPISDFFYSPDGRTRANKFSYINFLARRIAKILFPRECKICGYTNHVEVHHIHSISSFSTDTPIGVVNSKDNLVYLCPNHHWEVEHNIIQL